MVLTLGLDVNTTNRLRLIENDGTLYYDTFTFAASVQYYTKFKRDESVGAYGTAYGYIYDDAARTSLLDTLSQALHAKRDYAYVKVVLCPEAAETGENSGRC